MLTCFVGDVQPDNLIKNLFMHTNYVICAKLALQWDSHTRGS